MMTSRSDEIEDFEYTLAEGIAAIMATEEDLSQPDDLADLFLFELNRLWADPEPLMLS